MKDDHVAVGITDEAHVTDAGVLDPHHFRTACLRLFDRGLNVCDAEGEAALVRPEREVVVLGVGERLEIWAASVWDREEQSVIGAYVAGMLRPDAS